jgi:hypothetical protein
MGLHEDHTTSTDSSWRCLGQVLYFKYHGHGRLELNDLSTIKAELFVIIEDSVHVLNPHSIDGTIKYNPFSIRGFSLRTVSDLIGKDSICPFTTIKIISSIKLVLSHTFRVDIVCKNIDKFWIILNCTNGSLESLNDF